MRTICERLIRLVSRQAPAALDRYPRGFTGDVAHPARSIETRSPPGLLAPTLVTLPSMSRVPRAPFFLLPFSFLLSLPRIAALG